MAAELQVINTAGTSVYAVLVASTGRLGGQFWNNVAEEFQEFGAAQWANYDVPLTEKAGTGLFFANMPTAFPVDVTELLVVFYQGTDGSPLVADTKIEAWSYSLTTRGWLQSLAIAI